MACADTGTGHLFTAYRRPHASLFGGHTSKATRLASTPAGTKGNDVGPHGLIAPSSAWTMTMFPNHPTHPAHIGCGFRWSLQTVQASWHRSEFHPPLGDIALLLPYPLGMIDHPQLDPLANRIGTATASMASAYS